MPLFSSGPSTSSKGEPLTWKCAYCGAENDISEDLCDGCGDKRPKSISSSVIAPATPTGEDFEAKLEPEEPVTADDDEDEEDAEEAELEPPETITAPEPAAAPEPIPPSTGGKYYLVFVNTPASSLIKTRAQVEFEDFPVVTIGRNPENIIVIPDPEVSRKHAQLTLEGSRVMVKDLKSSNGTFVYDGKEFQRVSDSVEVKPNTVIKFGNNTIVRLVSD